MKLARLAVGGFFLLLINTIYLSTTAAPTIFYMANVLLHLGLGLILFLILITWIVRRAPEVRSLPKLTVILLFAAGAIGVVLIWTGAYRPYRSVLWAHIATAVIGSAALLIHLHTRLRGRGAFRLLPIAALALGIAIPGAVIWHTHSRADTIDRIFNPPSPPLSMNGEGDGDRGPFFPSSAQTSSGGKIPSNFFMTAQMCGRCHADIYKQWFSSAHHFSSFNNQWYRKSIEYMQDVIGTKPSKWCGGCHDHAVIFNGMMDTPIRKIVHTPEAQAGLSCTSCHSIVHVKSTMGQGDFTIEYPALHDVAVSNNKVLQRLHDFLVFTDPAPHKRVFMKNFIRKDTAAFCSSCHKVHLDVPVNHYRWVRGFNEYDNWQASGVSGQGARSFYYPPKPMKCADCHMPLVDAHDPAAVGGKVHSHRFPGANTALPFVNQDEEQLRVVENFLKAKQVTVDIFALARTQGEESRPVRTGEGPQLASTFAIGEEAPSYGARQAVVRAPAEVIAPLNRVNPVVKRGESVRVEVVVRTRKVGHFFPGGTVDAFDVWLELQAKDDRGKILFWSGSAGDDGKGPVDPAAHFYRARLLDEHGNVINKRNAWAARSVAYVRLIPPGTADTIHYRLEIPPDCGDKIYLKAKVNYRKFAWWNTHWAFAGIRDPAQGKFALTQDYDDGQWVFDGNTADVSGKIKAIPDLPTVVMAEDNATLNVANSEAQPKTNAVPQDPKDRERWNDYGIGLLLQGDLKGAEQAFLKVTQLDPKYADGWVNIGRSRIQEGDMNGAQDVLKKAMVLNPDLAKTQFFLAMVLKAQGRYDEAALHLLHAAASYPRDRVVRDQLGRILFLQRKYQQAIGEFQQALSVDPEDLPAHYGLMLCYQGLANTKMAEKERVLYLRFKADEASQTITGPYRQLHPEDNNERQPIHEHTSAKIPDAYSPKAAGSD